MLHGQVCTARTLNGLEVPVAPGALAVIVTDGLVPLTVTWPDHEPSAKVIEAGEIVPLETVRSAVPV